MCFALRKEAAEERRVVTAEKGFAATDVRREAERRDDQHGVAEHVAALDYALDRHRRPPGFPRLQGGLYDVLVNRL
jgi:hypothetical protein